MANYSDLIKSLRAYFNSGTTKSLSWRRKQLEAFCRMLDEEGEALCDALSKDLHKHKTESLLMEVNIVRNDIVHTLNSLDSWAKPQRVKKTLVTIADDCYIHPDPYGVVLIIGAWNYPVQLTLLPLVGAIAAGNCCVVKPSEVAPETAKVIERILPLYLDRSAYAVVNGAVPETQALLTERWDYILYTGNGTVAKIIYEAAAKHLTPVTLELGGKSPVYIDASSDLDIVANRLVWGKYTNSGQTCIAPDYVLSTKDVQDKLVASMKKAIHNFYGDNPQSSECLGRIINNRHFQRVKSLTSNGQIAIGGKMDESENYIEPTVLVNCKPSDRVMQEEVFGPVLPMMTVKNEDEAIEYINSRDKPLAMYIFTQNSSIANKFLVQTTAGGVTVNDTMMHASVATLPFGGVGNSGMGSYHGKFSFDMFSHQKSVMVRKQAMEKINNLRYPPYTERKTNLLNWAMKTNPAKRGIAGFFPIMIAGVVIAFFLKMLGVERYFPSALKQ